MAKVKRPDENNIIVAAKKEDKSVGHFIKIKNSEIEPLINVLEQQEGEIRGILKQKVQSDEVECTRCKKTIGDGYRISNNATEGVLFFCGTCSEIFSNEVTQKLEEITPEIISEEI